MSRKKQVLVVNHPQGWAVKRPGAKRASFVSRTQRNAQDKAIQIAKREGNTEVRVQGRNGKWRSCDTYGYDPCPPKDTEH